jgi:hypothetical protein
MALVSISLVNSTVGSSSALGVAGSVDSLLHDANTTNAAIIPIFKYDFFITFSAIS